MAGAFVPLVDFPNSQQLQNLYSNDVNLSTFTNSAYSAVVVVGAGLLMLMIGVGAWEYVGKSAQISESKQQAKDHWKGAVFGFLFLLTLGVWLDQINPNLRNLIVPFPNAPTTESALPANPATASEKQRALDAILDDEDRVRRRLKGQGINPYKDPCKTLEQRNCTNVGLLGPAAITGLEILKRDCKCATIPISGGTEFFAHGDGVKTEHGPNKPVVDILKVPNGQLDKYIRSGVPSLDSTFRKDKRTINVYKIDGGTFFEEDNNHWHVRFR